MKELKFNGGILGLTKRKGIFILRPFEEDKFFKALPLADIPEEISFKCELSYLYEKSALCIEYDIEEGFYPLQEMVKRVAFITRLEIASNIIRIGKYFEECDNFNTIFSPINLFVNTDGSLRLLFCGMNDIIPAKEFYRVPIFKQVKDLIIFLINNDEKLNEIRKRDLIDKIDRAKIYMDLEEAIQEEVDAMELSINTPIKYKDDLELIESYIVEPDLEKNSKKKGCKKKSKRFLLGLALTSIFIASMILFDLPTLLVESMGKKEQQEQLDPRFIEGLRLASIQKYQESARLFSQVDYDSLSGKDKSIVLFTYLFADPEKAFELEPELAPGLVYAYVEKRDYDKALKIAIIAKNKQLIQYIEQQKKNNIKRSKASHDIKEEGKSDIQEETELKRRIIDLRNN